jgi:hypothetical protein
MKALTRQRTSIRPRAELAQELEVHLVVLEATDPCCTTFDLVRHVPLETDRNLF